MLSLDAATLIHHVSQIYAQPHSCACVVVCYARAGIGAHNSTQKQTHLPKPKSVSCAQSSCASPKSAAAARYGEVIACVHLCVNPWRTQSASTGTLPAVPVICRVRSVAVANARDETASQQREGT